MLEVAVSSFLYEMMVSPLTETKDDMSKLPDDKMKDIQKNIRDGASDLSQNWANALELTHTAYRASQVQRPTPDMSSGWSQYEENIQYAVQQLAKARGIDADWRMSASMFEAEAKKYKFKVTIHVPNNEDKVSVIEANSINDALTTLKRQFAAQAQHTKVEFEVVDERPKGQKLRVIYIQPTHIKSNIHITVDRI